MISSDAGEPVVAQRCRGHHRATRAPHRSARGPIAARDGRDRAAGMSRNVARSEPGSFSPGANQQKLVIPPLTSSVRVTRCTRFSFSSAPRSCHVGRGSGPSKLRRPSSSSMSASTPTTSSCLSQYTKPPCVRKRLMRFVEPADGRSAASLLPAPRARAAHFCRLLSPSGPMLLVTS